MERVKKPKESAMQAEGLVSMPAGLFVEVLGSIPADVWGGVWVPERTIMLRKASKAVQETMDKMMLPVVVRGNRWFWFHSRGSCDERWGFILQQLLALAGRSSITTLELLCGADVDVGGLAGVLALCPGLAQLHMHSNGMLGAAGMGLVAGMLGRVRQLTHLALRRNGMGVEGVRQLAAVLFLLPGLARVDVSCNEIGAEGVRALAPALALCPALSHVDVSSNLIGVEGGKSLGGVLRQCAVLTHLNVADNGVTELDGLAGGLVECASLTHVNLANNELSEDGTDMLVAVLACCRLQFLDLKNCVRASSVARGLGLCTSLTELRMHYNGINGPGAVEYARALQGCTGLARLDLRGNSFNMHATLGLSALLPQYASLAELSLPFNSIRVVGASVLLTAAGACAALRRIDLESNYIRDDYKVWPRSSELSPSFSVSFVELLDVLRGCTTLERLNLKYNDFSEEGAERLLASWGGRAGGLACGARL
jgi:Ran GTPase-activating protein (RanGAP) involved in mRNA processing and transport